ncbi:MAG: bifunctional folylpolyglutamate synthase/dihydrofolate synthase [Rhodospirillales bacterium]|nr:bifunctional folylpolyglutamate synthase/dihydrofolate synthase [Rhodospirillales bacterium]
MIAPNPALDAALAGLGRLHPKIIDLSLGRIQARLSALGNPERRLPPVFHVAGTNGKGSTIAFLRAFLEAAGYCCHVYTSPHLVSFNERIRLAGKLIDDDMLLSLIREVEAAGTVDGVEQPITNFEITTAIAVLAFSRVPADACLIEVGLGGRFDATNLFPRPYATAVTRISRDHRQFFGDVLADIAGEKAGIFKHGVPAIVAEQPDADVCDRLTREAEAVGAKLSLHGRDWWVAATLAGFRYRDANRDLDLPAPALVGRHQLMNAGTALAMLGASDGFAVDAAAVSRGLGSVEWPGRLQRLTRGPLVDLLPKGWELWLDGAHNDSGGEALGMQAAEWQVAGSPLPLDIVFGVRAEKRPADVLRPLAPFASRLRAISIPGDAPSLSADEAARAAHSAGIADAASAASPIDAVKALVAGCSAPRRILICGSLYLAGAILAENG